MEEGYVELVRILLEAGSNVKHLDFVLKESILDVAYRVCASEELKELLRSHGSTRSLKPPKSYPQPPYTHRDVALLVGLYFEVGVYDPIYDRVQGGSVFIEKYNPSKGYLTKVFESSLWFKDLRDAKFPYDMGTASAFKGTYSFRGFSDRQVQIYYELTTGLPEIDSTNLPIQIPADWVLIAHMKGSGTMFSGSSKFDPNYSFGNFTQSPNSDTDDFYRPFHHLCQDGGELDIAFITGKLVKYLKCLHRSLNILLAI